MALGSEVPPALVKGGPMVVRSVQVVAAVAACACCGWAVNTLQLVGLSLQIFEGGEAYAFLFFTFSWTMIYLGWLLIALGCAPQAYNLWANLTLECTTLVFWLAAFALLARNSAEYDVSIRSVQEGRDFLDATYAAAGVSALVMCLFVCTLVHLSIVTHKVIKTHKSGGTVHPPQQELQTHPGQAPGHTAFGPNPSAPTPAPAFGHGQPHAPTTSPMAGMPSPPSTVSPAQSQGSKAAGLYPPTANVFEMSTTTQGPMPPELGSHQSPPTHQFHYPAQTYQQPQGPVYEMSTSRQEPMPPEMPGYSHR